MISDNNSKQEPTIFVWRYKMVELELFSDNPFPYIQLYKNYHTTCPFCNSLNSEYVRQEENTSGEESYGRECNRCGFWWSHTRCPGFGLEYCESDTFEYSMLREFAINDARLGMEEIGAHLRKRFKDIEDLSPRNFEYLIARVYTKLGYSVRLTKQTRDDGFDMILLDNGTDKQILIECKRFKNNRCVGIEIVDRLLGVQLRKGIKQARIVTTGYFSLPAKRAAKEAKIKSGYSMDLVDANDFSTELDILDTRLPPLHVNRWLAE